MTAESPFSHHPQRAVSVLQGHLGGRSRKRGTDVGLSRSPVEHHCALDWPPSVLHRRVLSRPDQKVCFNPTHDDIAKTEGLHFRQKKSVVDGVKGLGRIKVVNINCVTLVHHVRHGLLYFIDLQPCLYLPKKAWPQITSTPAA